MGSFFTRCVVLPAMLLMTMLLTPVYATSWPILSPPTLSFLLAHNMINTANCPAGEGKLNPQLKINISQHFCRRFCPPAWQWVLNGDAKCRRLSDYEFQRFTFDYYKQGDEENETLYTVTTAHYGKADSASPINFTFTTESNNHWRCSEMSEEYHTVVCANDV